MSRIELRARQRMAVASKSNPRIIVDLPRDAVARLGRCGGRKETEDGKRCREEKGARARGHRLSLSTVPRFAL
jgi:hypothetical protein